MRSHETILRMIAGLAARSTGTIKGKRAKAKAPGLRASLDKSGLLVEVGGGKHGA